MSYMNLAFIRWVEVLNAHSISDIAIYGAGDLGLEGYSSLISAGITIKFFIDQTARNETFFINDLPVIAPEAVVNHKASAIVICSEKFSTQIKEKLLSIYNGDEFRPLILTMFPEKLKPEGDFFYWVDSTKFWMTKSNEGVEQSKLYIQCAERLKIMKRRIL